MAGKKIQQDRREHQAHACCGRAGEPARQPTFYETFMQGHRHTTNSPFY